MRLNKKENSKISFLVFIGIILFNFQAYAQSELKREIRAAWITTAYNIDWPSSANISSSEQKVELVALLDLLKQNNFNAVALQIRPCGDAFYQSEIEPWSRWLNGKQGNAPDPYYDPLEFAIKECRSRGIDVHVWLNPYRASNDTTGVSNAANHITKIHPEWFVNYGSIKYFNPGLQEVRDYICRVIGDVVTRYDIDAVHLDDYFYPYRIDDIDFPDDRAFEQYPLGFSREQKDDWRRYNIDLIIQQLQTTIKSIKPWVEFGISPFGVWRNDDQDPRGSATRAGQTNYDDLYSDVLKWQKEGWIDYVVPQLYWHIGLEVADYTILVDWWSKNSYGCPLYIGHSTAKVNKKATEKSWRSSQQLIKQLTLNKNYPNIGGSFYFSSKALIKDIDKMNERFSKFYRYPALVPINYRIAQISPEIPQNTRMEVVGSEIRLSWEKGANTKNFVIYKFRKNKPAIIEQPEYIYEVTSDISLSIPVTKDTNPDKYYFVITSQSPTNMESPAVWFY